MFKIVVACALLAFGAAIFTGPMWAADVEKTHDGFVVSVEDNKLSMTDKEGKNPHSHLIGADVKITLNGEASELASLKKGDAITVTTDEDGTVTAVDATRKES